LEQILGDGGINPQGNERCSDSDTSVGKASDTDENAESAISQYAVVYIDPTF